MIFADRILSDILNKTESMSNALLTSPPAFSAGNIVEDGFLISDTISVAACFRKSVKVAAGKGVVCGKNSTVSLHVSDLVRGMQH